METGKIDIQFKENTNKLSVHIQPSEDGTVWLTKHQIADLFDVYIQTVTAGLRTIFQKELLLQEQVTKINRFTNEQGKECQTEFYNLEVIITLGFCMKGGICMSFREWVHERIKYPVAYLPKPPLLIQFGQTLIW
ncbi:MAG: hypothetical protein EGP82_00490 [Odoribacter splanchnicus]|nr:hypothetical protein [Odoribacter splanchnicus]